MIFCNWYSLRVLNGTDNTYNRALVNKYNPTAEHFVVIGRPFPLTEAKRDAYISLLTNYVQIAAQ